MVCRVVLPSETYAHKAHRVLAANGLISEIIRASGSREGCTFGLRVVGSCEAVSDLLGRAGIPVRRITSERGGP
ncbi:MAG: hypothetical protein IJ055_10220 [Oscillospiraceae bacterium]|nr:hypothetical protein [Oscillospiraceae bacterium]